MMVSKIAVIALVAIVACPILIGYAMNLTETTETGYRDVGDPVNVTPILQNGTGYTLAHADPYKLNTDIHIDGQPLTKPYYNNITSAKTSMKGNIVSASGSNVIGGSSYIGSYTSYYVYAEYTNSVGYLTLNFNLYISGNYVPQTVSHFQSAYYDYTTSQFIVNYYTSDTTINSTSFSNFHHIVSYSKTGSYNGFMYCIYDATNESKYIDLSGGFTVYDNQLTYSNPPNPTGIFMPSNTQSAIMTINLDSITDANYSVRIDGTSLTKTTTGGVVKWTLYNSWDLTYYDLYYDPTISDNTYQLFKVRDYTTNKLTMEYRYVGHWPTLIGEANYYQKYTLEVGTLAYFQNISITYASSGRTPIIRMDDAQFSAFEYPILTNKTYDPASFRDYPVTTVSDLKIYGTSLTFGGIVYTVTDGKINISGHAVPVNNLKFSSTPNDAGTFDNKIGNTLISKTANPSTITFGGTWSANISTTAQESFTYSHTEWNAGSFAWDGIDQNFLIVGLITCLGVFIALGIYARMKGSGGIIPLMIVVGGAAMVFFVML